MELSKNTFKLKFKMLLCISDSLTVCCQDLCFDLYEVELSNKQGENIDKLIEYIKNQQLVRITNFKYNFFP